MDWKESGDYVLLVGVFPVMLTLFIQVNGRPDTMQAEMNRRFDQRFDQIFEVLRLFEGRISGVEERAGIGPGNGA